MTRGDRGWWSAPIVGFGVAAVLLWVFLRRTDPAVVLGTLQRASWPLIALAAAVRLFSVAVSGARWQALLRPTAVLPLGSVVAITMMGSAAHAFIPAQAADLLRPLLLRRWYRTSFAEALATITAEWILDGIAIGGLFAGGLLWQSAAPLTLTGLSYVHQWITSLVICTTVLCVGWFVFRITARVIQTVPGLTPIRRPRSAVTGALQRFAAGFEALRRPHDLLVLIAYSLAVSLLVAVSAWLTLLAFDVSLPPVAGVLLLGLVTFAGMVPTPGAVGGFHAICQLGLVAIFHVDRARTVIPVIALHAVLYWTPAVAGGVCMAAPPMWWRGRR